MSFSFSIDQIEKINTLLDAVKAHPQYEDLQKLIAKSEELFEGFPDNFNYELDYICCNPNGMKIVVLITKEKAKFTAHKDFPSGITLAFANESGMILAETEETLEIKMAFLKGSDEEVFSFIG
jgi:hypothetical protein